jgi:signal transduction histidine kinase
MGYSTAETGTGFGLAIVAEIAAAHGWSVEVTESASGGARFEITGVEIVD